MAAMPNGDWLETVIKFLVVLAGGIAGAFTTTWRLGRNSAKAENSVDKKISALREEMRTAMAAHVQKSESSRETLVDQFKESFDGMRRQIDEHRYYTEKDFLKKEDFKDFRDEYREDMRDIKTAIASIAKTK